MSHRELNVSLKDNFTGDMGSQTSLVIFYSPKTSELGKKKSVSTFCGSAYPMLVPLWLITDSSSSRKMVDGAWYLASSNRTCRQIHTFTQIHSKTCKVEETMYGTLNMFFFFLMLHLTCCVCWKITYPDQFLRVSSPLADDAGGWNVEEGRLTLCSHGLGQQCLTRTCVYVSEIVTTVHVRKNSKLLDFLDWKWGLPGGP